MAQAVAKVANDTPSAQLYEAFAECFQNPTQENFRRLLTSHIGEKDFIDFKAVWPEHSGLAKHILAMGNSGGGAIVIGVKEEDDHTLTPVGLTAASGRHYQGHREVLAVPTAQELGCCPIRLHGIGIRTARRQDISDG